MSNVNILEMDGYLCACKNSLGCNMPALESVKSKMEWMDDGWMKGWVGLMDG